MIAGKKILKKMIFYRYFLLVKSFMILDYLYLVEFKTNRSIPKKVQLAQILFLMLCLMTSNLLVTTVIPRSKGCGI